MIFKMKGEKELKPKREIKSRVVDIIELLDYKCDRCGRGHCSFFSLSKIWCSTECKKEHEKEEMQRHYLGETKKGFFIFNIDVRRLLNWNQQLH
tara:strand:+ start:864 stop:1145 length:282 start_codon:yes stop_codon:yes gene_type:complete